MSEAALRSLAGTFAALRRDLAAIPDAADRSIARDALRDALDRDADRLEPAVFVAGSFLVEGILHRSARFEILRLRQRDHGTRHVLKTVRRECATDPLARRLVASEARHQARIAHPACLPLRATLRLADGRPAILTDLMEAPTLAQVIGRGPLAPAKLARLGLRICEALGAVHAAGLVHGDPTPANLFLPDADAGSTILFDFGLSRPIGEGFVADLASAGTPGFAAPEVRDGFPAAPAEDLYALGRILLAASPPRAAGPWSDLAGALASIAPADRPDLAETVSILKSCGTEATEEPESGRHPATGQAGRI